MDGKKQRQRGIANEQDEDANRGGFGGPINVSINRAEGRYHSRWTKGKTFGPEAQELDRGGKQGPGEKNRGKFRQRRIVSWNVCEGPRVQYNKTKQHKVNTTQKRPRPKHSFRARRGDQEKRKRQLRPREGEGRDFKTNQGTKVLKFSRRLVCGDKKLPVAQKKQEKTNKQRRKTRKKGPSKSWEVGPKNYKRFEEMKQRRGVNHTPKTRAIAASRPRQNRRGAESNINRKDRKEKEHRRATIDQQYKHQKVGFKARHLVAHRKAETS